MISPAPQRLRAGEFVQVRSKQEILGTLDARGMLGELPFMPEMMRYCGKTFRVSKRAHKTCDPAVGIEGRSMKNAVHLEDLRCDGSDHDGCQARCLIFWREEWLKRVENNPVAGDLAGEHEGESLRLREIEQAIREGVKVPPAPGQTEPTYMCQNTQVKFATKRLDWWDFRQYVEDYTSGNVSLYRLAAGGIFTLWRIVAEAGVGVGTPMRWLYDQFQRAIGGSPYPFRFYGVPDGTQTPKSQINLRQGEHVRVKPHQEILKTLDCHYRNRGLYFDWEMVPFTERHYEIDYRVEQIIDERTSKMIKFKSDALVLKNVKCESRYAPCRRFCPRAIYPYWREIWLERVADQD